MDKQRDFQFQRFSIIQINFIPRNIQGSIEYGVSIDPEVNVENKNEIRLVLGVKLRDPEDQEVFFDCLLSGIFSLSEDFGDFNINFNEEQQMIEMVLEEYENLIYNLSKQAFDKPMVIGFDLQELIRNFSNENENEK